MLILCLANSFAGTGASNHPHHLAIHGLGPRHGRTPQKGPGGFTHLLVAVDKFTKWIEDKPITNIRSEEVVKFDEDMTSIHMTMLGEPYGDQGDQRGCHKQEGGPKLIRFESPRCRPKSSSSPSRVPGPICLKLVTQNASKLYFR